MYVALVISDNRIAYIRMRKCVRVYSRNARYVTQFIKAIGLGHMAVGYNEIVPSEQNTRTSLDAIYRFDSVGFSSCAALLN